MKEKIPKELFCKDLGFVSQENPLGTATYATHYIVMEVDPPWEKSVEDSRSIPPLLPALLQKSKQRGISYRFQGIMPDDEYSQLGMRRIAIFTSSEHEISQFKKEEFLVPEEEIGRFLPHLINDSSENFDSFRQTQKTRDILVCTHGRKDRCCGKFGYPLYQYMRENFSQNEVRIWRTSHTGGHRFAPTLIDFPEGRFWSHINEDLVSVLINKETHIENLSRHHRGLGSLPAIGQIIEGELFMQQGWRWCGLIRSIKVGVNDGTNIEGVVDVLDPQTQAQERYSVTLKRHKDRLIPAGCGDIWEKIPQYHIVTIKRLF